MVARRKPGPYFAGLARRGDRRVPSSFDLSNNHLRCRLEDKSKSTYSPLDSAERILRESAYQPIRGLTCGYSDGVLVVEGRVASYFLKQLAQAALRDVDGVSRVDNRIEVTP